MPRLVRFSWMVLAANLLVILWGAVVRVTGSGAGCGSHWPLCNGEVIPRNPTVETLIELSHRLTSGIALILVLWLLVWVLKVVKALHPARSLAGWSMGFMMGEVAVGAALVSLDYVGQNTSGARAVVMGLHLVNTFFLLAALALTSWALASGRGINWRQITGRPDWWRVAVAVVGLLLVGASGAVAALGDTLFPTRSLAEGLSRDFDPSSHPAVRLRMLHPVFAVLVAVHLFLLCRPRLEGGARRTLAASSLRWSNAVVWLVLAQLAAGVVNLVLLAPAAMQLLHLLLADGLWLAFVLWVADRWSTS